jgi:Fuc2NAc and GlcNAc transferase
MIKVYATKKALVDIPNERSSHSVAIPHGGGIAIAVTWFIGISYLYYFQKVDSSLYMALLMGVILSAVSYLDDLYRLSVKLRLLVQICVAGSGLYLLGGLNDINLFFLSVDNSIVTNIFAFLMILWFINLYNFLDGIDGYAGSEALFLGVAGFILFGNSIFMVLVASVLGFLVWNWHKAKIFMGDVGSTLLGYNIAIFTIYYSNQDAVNLWVWIILFEIFWFDATLTLYKRYRNGERLSQAHNKHAYQRLVQSGWSHSKVVVFSIMVNIILFCLVYFISNIFIAFIISLFLLYTIWMYIKSQKGFES